MERQDIDALLIGALYGELTPADEVRLAAHLDSHPADRGALDDMKSARQAVRESRIFDIQLDPPQAVSALLLQEAHRRAPRRVVSDDGNEGWFARFTRMFMAHPAMAAAAMLVVVVGVAGTLYVKKGDHFAEPRMSAPGAPAAESVPVAETKNADPSSADHGAASQAAAGSGYQVGLADTSLAKEAPAQPEKREGTRSRDDDTAKPKVAVEQKRKTAPPRGISVTTKGAMPKDFAENDKAESALGFDGRSAGAVPTAQPAPPPPAVAATTPAKRSEAPADNKLAADPTLIAWAKQRHELAIKAAANGDCHRAAALANEVNGRAPDYYAQKMATDRSLKACQTYIANERDKESEQRQKSRTSKRVNADESYEAPAPSK